MNICFLGRSRPGCIIGCLLLCIFLAVLFPRQVSAANVDALGITDDEGINENRTVLVEVESMKYFNMLGFPSFSVDHS